MVPDKFKHLDEENHEQAPEGFWLPGIPLPLYTHGKGLKRLRQAFSCACGRVYDTEAEYREHYRRMQLFEMNQAMGMRMEVYQGKAMFWRRTTFVYRYAEPAEITLLEDTFDDERLHDGLWAEAASAEDLLTLNAALEKIWKPVYDRMKAKGEEADALVEDQSAAEAKADFAEPYTVVNSRGVTYYLNMKEVSLRGGKMVSIWFFSKEFRPETGQRSLPGDLVINENPRNGFLTVKRIEKDIPRGPEGSEDQ